MSLTLNCMNWVSFDFNVSYSSCWGYSLINTLKLYDDGRCLQNCTMTVSTVGTVTFTRAQSRKNHDLYGGVVATPPYRSCSEYMPCLFWANIRCRVSTSPESGTVDLQFIFVLVPALHLLYYNSVSIFPPGRRKWLATQRDDPNSGAWLRETGSSAARWRDSRRCWLRYFYLCSRLLRRCWLRYFCLCSRLLQSTLAEPWARHQIGPPSDALQAIRADVMTASLAGCMLSKSSKGANSPNFTLGAQRTGKKELTITWMDGGQSVWGSSLQLQWSEFT